MRLAEALALLGGAAAVADPSLELTGITNDSRLVRPGMAFVAVRGLQSDGHRYIGQALERGAACVVVEEMTTTELTGAPIVQTPNSRRALAVLADAFYRRPSTRLQLVGITGTNGKTTTTYLVRSILQAAGTATGLIGTIEYRIGDKVYPAPNTTPDSLDLQRLLAEMADCGMHACVMEVSSHALALDRTACCRFAVAAFTNLTQDHLDFHQTMDAYRDAKLLLFAGLAETAHAVVNRDDPGSAAFIEATKAPVITTGCSPDAEIRPDGFVMHTLAGLTFDVMTPTGRLRIESPLVGRHNVYNILTAIGIATSLGISGENIVTGIRDMHDVPGRMQKIDVGQDFGVIVDYAHTDDALTKLLASARELTTGQIITVFGCGGNRDRTKRPKMGHAAALGSDRIIVTSDNPRNEDPITIIREIESGIRQAGRLGGRIVYTVIADRRAAIAEAINSATPGDIVLIAGKGHEDHQIIGDTKFHSDDRETAQAALRQRMTLEGILNSFEQGEIGGISTDSRTIQPGALFVALSGERFDGHRFVADVIRKGAWGALVDREWLADAAPEIQSLRNIIPVENTLEALQQLSSLHRRRFAIPLVGVTGSNGKTTTKEMLASILGQGGPVLKTEGNLNNHIGVPLTLMRLDRTHRAAVVEMGMSAPGEIALLARIAAPTIGVITNIGPAHLEFFGGTEGVADAKAELLEQLRDGGIAILNADDRHFDRLSERHGGHTITFGIKNRADLSATDIEQGRTDTMFILRAGDRQTPVCLSVAGEHNVYNALAAAAAAFAAGISLEQVKTGLEAFRPVSMRSEIRELNGRTVLADCYNANPASMKAAIEMLAGMKSGGRTIAVLGDMLELGGTGLDAHREIGRLVAQRNIDALITVGSLGEEIARGAIAAAMPKDAVYSAASHADAASRLRAWSASGDVVLLKGSRGMKMETILEMF